MSYITPWRKHSKYEALCEGDDFWIDPIKLQLQVDFLDNNEDYSMCFHQAFELWEGQHAPMDIFANVEDRDYRGPEILKDWIVATASAMERTSILESKEYKRLCESPNFLFGDTPMFVAMATLGKVRGMTRCMCVYRRTADGATFAGFNGNIEKEIRRAKHFLEFYRVFGNNYKEKSIELYQKAVIRIITHYPSKYRKWGREFNQAITLSPIRFLRNFVVFTTRHLVRRKKTA